MSEERGSVGTSLLVFLAGAAVGATIIALTTPKTGPELREDIKGLGNRVKDRFSRLQARDEDRDRVGA
jgi:gas vesicle protein